ncbi:MAG: helix-turn-helix domain-containing protein [Oscillospiraceae bacterium]|nr:helix-turn-helix domain-containing protein [Oscillospiraceae bacterium]
MKYPSTKHKYLKMVPVEFGFKCKPAEDIYHMHDCIEIWYALRGKSIHTVGDETFTQTAGTCVIVPAFVSHVNEIIETDEKPIFAAINVSDEALRIRGHEQFSYYDKKILFDGKVLPRFHKFSTKAYSQANKIIYKMSSEFSALPDASFDTLINLYVDFLNLLGGEKSTFKVSKSLLKRTESILDASDYILDKYSEKITIKKLCEIADMSESRFYAYFKDITGVTPMNYLECVRMAHAKKFLLTRGKRPSDIVDLVAASDHAHLCRSFKNYFGKTMSEYKKSNQEEEQLIDLADRERRSNIDFLYEFFKFFADE